MLQVEEYLGQSTTFDGYKDLALCWQGVECQIGQDLNLVTLLVMAFFDLQDIQLRVGSKEAPKQPNLPSLLAKEHISNRYRFSLRVRFWFLPFSIGFMLVMEGFIWLLSIK